MLSWLARVIKGIVIALGFILPGISGGVLAAILGIYERMIGFLAHPFKDLKENVCTLFQLPSVCFWESAYFPTRLNTCLKIIRFLYYGALRELLSVQFLASSKNQLENLTETRLI